MQKYIIAQMNATNIACEKQRQLGQNQYPILT